MTPSPRRGLTLDHWLAWFETLHPKRIDLRLSYGELGATLDAQDDGSGFDPGAVAELGTQHFGLQGMRERAEGIGAKLTIESQPGQGTRVRLAVPAPPRWSRFSARSRPGQA